MGGKLQPTFPFLMFSTLLLLLLLLSIPLLLDLFDRKSMLRRRMSSYYYHYYTVLGNQEKEKKDTIHYIYSEEDRRPQFQSHDLSDRAQVCASILHWIFFFFFDPL
jgi:hypothetical protein